jgi:hypothetical protein
VGVEPTRDSLAAPPGFEVRTPHRRRFSSKFSAWRFRREIDGPEQIQAVFVDPAQIATPERDAVPIEEIEYLNRDLPAIVHTIAKLRGGEYAAWFLCCEFRSD